MPQTVWSLLTEDGTTDDLSRPIDADTFSGLVEQISDTLVIELLLPVTNEQERTWMALCYCLSD